MSSEFRKNDIVRLLTKSEPQPIGIVAFESVKGRAFGTFGVTWIVAGAHYSFPHNDCDCLFKPDGFFIGTPEYLAVEVIGHVDEV